MTSYTVFIHTADGTEHQEHWDDLDTAKRQHRYWTKQPGCSATLREYEPPQPTSCQPMIDRWRKEFLESIRTQPAKGTETDS